MPIVAINYTVFSLHFRYTLGSFHFFIFLICQFFLHRFGFFVTRDISLTFIYVNLPSFCQYLDGSSFDT